MPLNITQDELSSLLNGPPTKDPSVAAQVMPQQTSNLVARTAEVARGYGIDTNALGLTPEEIKRVTGISLPEPNASEPSAPAPSPPENAAPAATVQPEGSILPQGLRIGSDGRIEVASSDNPASNPNALVENLGGMAKRFLDNPVKGVYDFGKGMVTDVIGGVSALGDLVMHAPEQIADDWELSSVQDALRINPNDYAARNKLAAIKAKADAINEQQTQNFWKAATTASLFIPFGGPVSLGGKALIKAGMAETGEALLASLERKGISGVVSRLVDRAGKGAAMGGAYGYFASEGDLQTSLHSAELMGSMFGAGPLIGAPLKSVMGVTGAAGKKAVNAFNQLPLIAETRQKMYNGPIGKVWDNMVTATESVFDQAGLGNLLDNMHVARMEAVRLGGYLDRSKTENLAGLDADGHAVVSGLIERRISPSSVRKLYGEEKGSILVRAAADEDRRLKYVGQLLRAYGVPTYNAATGELYNFVLRDNYLPHIIVNPEALAADPGLRRQAIKIIAEKKGLPLPEAELHFNQWAERAKGEAEQEALHGVPGRATMEARLYGLPGYSLDLPNVLSTYYQRSARLIAFHRRLGRAVTNLGETGGADEVGPALEVPPASAPPAQQAVPAGVNSNAPTTDIEIGSKVTVTGKRGQPINGTLLEKDINDKGQVKVRVGTPGKKGTRTLTVSPSKLAARTDEKKVVAEVLVPKTQEEAPVRRLTARGRALEPKLPPLKIGDKVLFEGRPADVIGMSPMGPKLRFADGKEVGAFRADVTLASDADKPVIYGSYSDKAPQDMTPAEFAREFNNVQTAVSQTRARHTFPDIGKDHPAWAEYEKGNWKPLSAALGFSDAEQQDFARFVKLAGSGDPSAPHFDPTDPMHTDLYNWWKKQPREVATTPEPAAAVEPQITEPQVTVKPTGKTASISEFRKALKNAGYTPPQIAEEVRRAVAATTPNPPKSVPAKPALTVAGVTLSKEQAELVHTLRLQGMKPADAVKLVIGPKKVSRPRFTPKRKSA